MWLATTRLIIIIPRSHLQDFVGLLIERSRPLGYARIGLYDDIYFVSFFDDFRYSHMYMFLPSRTKIT